MRRSPAARNARDSALNDEADLATLAVPHRHRRAGLFQLECCAVTVPLT